MATGAIIAAIAAGAAISAFGAVQQGRAANQEAQFQSDILKQQAERESTISRQNEEDFRRGAFADLATRKAGLSGVEPGSGSPLLASEDFAGEVELQALRLRSGGEVRATRLQQQASLVRTRGQNARTAGFIRGGSLLLTGGGQAFAAGQ